MSDNLDNFGLPESEVFKPRTISNKDLGIPEFKVRKAKKPKPKYVKPESLKQLQLDYQAFKYKGKEDSFPPEYRLTYKFSDNSTNDLTKSIIAWLECHGHFGSRRNTQGTWNERLGMFIKSGSTKGAEDIDITIHGINIKGEVKFGKDKVRPAQVIYRKKIEDAGGHYEIFKTFDGFLEQIQQYL